jgi:radical SAM protein with 4Fe4S-binding SPASM domain
MGLKVARRILHAPEGSFNYVGKNPTIPEHGICLDFLTHLAISKNGDVSICVRYDPNRKGVLGNIKNNSLEELWNSELRMEWMGCHKQGCRDKIPLCSGCEFYGVPTQ